MSDTGGVVLVEAGADCDSSGSESEKTDIFI